MPRTSATNHTTGEQPRGQSVQSLDRALDLLEALAEAQSELGVSEVAERVGLHVSTAHRLLAVLVSRGYARRTQHGRYGLGPRLLTLASAAASPQQVDLRADARPALQELAECSGETTNLSLPVEGDIIYVEQVPSRHLVRMFTQIGTRVPAYCTAAGKAMLAYRDAGGLAEYLATAPFERHTARTLTTAAALEAELARARERGYAFDEGEMEDGVRCIAAPILDSGGQPRGAISVSGPSSRLGDERMREIAPLLLRATANLSARLGYIVPPERAAVR